MLRSVIAGSGSAIAPHRVTNDMLARIMDTSDAWIRERTGVETRYYVEPGTRTTDLGVIAAERALEMAGVAREDIDLVVFATMTPDQYFPGCGGLLQSRLGLRPVPAFDIRQQCSGFLYGLQLVDAHIRAGLARTALLVGAEIHSGFMPWGPGSWARLAGDVEAPLEPGEWETTTSVRHLTVLFGDAGGAVVITAADDGSRGVVDQALYADGTDAAKLCVPGNGFARRPYVDPEQIRRLEHVPVMDGRYVFKMATTRMTEAARALLERNGLTPGDLKLVLMHQANLRINEFVQRSLGLSDAQVCHNIQRYGNTTAATVPLLWDECVRGGRIEPGDAVLMVAFGAGMTWGATLVRA
ncbi:MAG: ketoacyl-ACP synthase III [Vicinamibacteraceae bacterium]|nr:ketoacyl-ACP synthase III [Vicinamibacteraceae bacterium]